MALHTTQECQTVPQLCQEYAGHTLLSGIRAAWPRSLAPKMRTAHTSPQECIYPEQISRLLRCVPENVHLSMYSVRFLQRAAELLAVEGYDPPDLQFTPRGYLFLALQAGVDQMMENYKMQTELGADVQCLWPKQLQKKFPWMRVGDVAAAVLGVNNEGWFDPWSLLTALRRKALSLGATYVSGTVTGLHNYEQPTTDNLHHPPASTLTTATVRLESGETREMRFSSLVVAAGAWSGALGNLAGLGGGPGALATAIPVEPRKRYVYCVHVPDGPWHDCPIFNDYTGVYFRPEFNSNQLYMCGMSPAEEDEPPTEDLEVDHQFFETHIWPVCSAYAGYYDYNTFDQNLIIGFHPVYKNMCLATGLSGHGIQQSVAVGRAVTECILDGKCHFINLERFGFQRILTNQPLKEKMVM
ncbi:FAD-dependent oxidoreductase domain-containing protein 1-like 2 [Homarus americanus]|uniref:FAD-dependent oxidoreductase domain-containing protein 1 n=1 Tax=Homarus americanus TaxID=6706 RepID=A0A8J5JXL4_HOMAM|nr:FAD-dependent oxidoreductase domain-containing protein 1-like 2 [Homarus americanus]